MGEVVGLGLRNLAHCPVELNLMPESTLKWQRFNQKKPYFIATVFSLVAVIAAIGLLFDKLAKNNAKELEVTQGQVRPMQEKSERFKRAYNDLKKTHKDLEQLAAWTDDRYYWADVMTELRQILVRVEGGMKARLRTDVGVWVEQLDHRLAPARRGSVRCDRGNGHAHTRADGSRDEPCRGGDVPQALRC